MASTDGTDGMRRSLSAETLEEIIAAFDVGNHAWGRYRHFVLSVAPHAQGVSTRAVRDALQEAAVAVSDAQSGDVEPLRRAIGALLIGLREYMTRLPEDVQRSELNEAFDAFDEAAVLLNEPHAIAPE